MFAGAQGPFAQDRPSSSSPPPTDTTQPVHYLPQLPSTNPTLIPAAPPAQHDSLPPAADSAFPPNSSFQFGSFSPDEVSKPAGTSTLRLPVQSQLPAEQQLDLQFGDVVPMQQLDVRPPGPSQMTGPMHPPSGPPPGPPPVGQSALSPFPVPRTAPGQAHAAQQSVFKPEEPLDSSVRSSSTAVAATTQASTGVDSIPDAVSASMHASTELPASQASSSLPVSPLPGRPDSNPPSTSSHGHFNHEGIPLSHVS